MIQTIGRCPAQSHQEALGFVAVAPLTTQGLQLAREAPASVLIKMFAMLPEGYRKVTGSIPEAYIPLLAQGASWCLGGWLEDWGRRGEAFKAGPQVDPSSRSKQTHNLVRNPARNPVRNL